MAVLFDESMSSDGTMDAIQTINDLVGKQCFVSGMASVNNDIRKLAENESDLCFDRRCAFSDRIITYRWIP